MMNLLLATSDTRISASAETLFTSVMTRLFDPSRLTSVSLSTVSSTSLPSPP